MTTMQGKRVLITGGGSGAGENLALGFAAQGAEVVIAGRRLNALQAVAAKGTGIRCVAGDVTDVGHGGLLGSVGCTAGTGSNGRHSQ